MRVRVVFSIRLSTSKEAAHVGAFAFAVCVSPHVAECIRRHGLNGAASLVAVMNHALVGLNIGAVDALVSANGSESLRRNTRAAFDAVHSGVLFMV